MNYAYIRGYYQGYMEKEAGDDVPPITQKEWDTAKQFADDQFYPQYGMGGLVGAGLGTAAGAGIGAMANGREGAATGALWGGTSGLMLGLLITALQRKQGYNELNVLKGSIK